MTRPTTTGCAAAAGSPAATSRACGAQLPAGWRAPSRPCVPRCPPQRHPRRCRTAPPASRCRDRALPRGGGLGRHVAVALLWRQGPALSTLGEQRRASAGRWSNMRPHRTKPPAARRTGRHACALAALVLLPAACLDDFQTDAQLEQALARANAADAALDGTDGAADIVDAVDAANLVDSLVDATSDGKDGPESDADASGDGVLALDATATDCDGCPKCQVDEDCKGTQAIDLCLQKWSCLKQNGWGQCVQVLRADAVACPSGGTACQASACDPATGKCQSQPASDGSPCSDLNGCTYGDACAAGACKPGAPKTCDDGNPCSKDECDPASATCVALPQAGTCTDFDPCTVGDTCANGTCKTFPKKCDDGESCTKDDCDPEAPGCVYLALTATCSDGDPCTVGDKCAQKECKPGASKACDDGNPCTINACDAASGDCAAVNSQAPCSDNNPCTIGDLCGGGLCVPGASKNCDDGNTCTNDACNAGSGDCSFVKNFSPCTDNNACTQGDICDSGACKSGAPKGCNDANPCTVDLCDAANGACSVLFNAAACDDGDGCSVNDQCQEGKCAAGPLKTCADLDTCTADACDAKSGGCTFAKIAGCGGFCSADTDCNDQNPCTVNACIQAKCAFPPNGEPCSDGDACSVGDQCSSGACKPGVPANCDDGNPCTDDPCAKATGACAHAANSATCSDNNACTLGDTCAANQCVAGVAKACDDSNPCTTDACDPVSGSCAATNHTGACSDGNPCTVGDGCGGGVCNSGAVLPCDDQNPCTNDACDVGDGVCKGKPNAATCSDGNACTQGDVCAAGACKPGVTLDCNDGNPCTTDACSVATGACSQSFNTAPCDDLNACTQDDGCGGGKCAPGVATACSDGNACTTDGCDASSGGCTSQPIVGCGGNCTKDSDCNDQNPCTTDSCTGGKCAFAPNTAGCEDSDPCTEADKCAGGQCQPGAAKPCSDGSVCTDDVCDKATGACNGTPNALPCSDGDACSIGEACVGGSCTGGKPVACNDGKVCTDDKCDAQSGACGFVINVAACSDGDACSVGDACAAGSCKAGPAKVCDDQNPCTNNACDKANGTCGEVNNAAPCTDANPCTLGDVCAAGKCAAGQPRACDDAKVCTDDSCADSTGSCVYAPNAVACEDGNKCTAPDVCAGGSCAAGAAKDCDDKDACTNDKCDASSGGCVFVPIVGCGGNCKVADDCNDQNPCTTDLCSNLLCAYQNNADVCSDGNPCTLLDACKNGGCVAGAAKGCDDGQPCTNDSCNPTDGACVTVSNTAPCDDGNQCTQGDLCGGGKCTAGQPKACDDKNACTVDGCDPSTGACTVKADDAAKCDDGNACSTGDACVAGKCVGVAVVCDDKNVCTQDACTAANGQCAYSDVAGGPCDDDSKCTTGDACLGGKCQPGTAKVCMDNNTCTADSCDPATANCAFNALTDGTACSDGNLCTLNDTCGGAVCKPKSSVACGDSNMCTSDQCNKTTGLCEYGPDLGKNGASCASNSPVNKRCWNGVCLIPWARALATAGGFTSGAAPRPDLAATWGASSKGELGTGSLVASSVPVMPKLAGSVDGVTLGLDHGCALVDIPSSNGTSGLAIQCWGAGTAGQLGDGLSQDSATPVKADGSGAKIGVLATTTWAPLHVDAGDQFSCAAYDKYELTTTTKAVRCWGTNTYGQLGAANPTKGSAVPVQVPNVGGAHAVSAGGGHACALTQSGLHCWGRNENGQVGNGTTGMSLAPVLVLAQSKGEVYAVSAGTKHTCAIRSPNRTVLCWGLNSDGQCGLSAGSPGSVVLPTNVQLGAGPLQLALAIAAGEKHTCAVIKTSDSSWRVYCWGANGDGQLGIGSNAASHVPKKVLQSAGGSEFADLVGVLAGRKHSCGVHGNGSVWCWGAGGDGQLGQGAMVGSTVPVMVSGSAPK
ncbi:MAG: hypothetical protein EXR79_06870 [Myxococcales bacterium]|nr:hypothetical protein [Myxococcales bacterium]